MKKLLICFLFIAAMAHAVGPGAPSSSGPNITDCLKWSIPYFCKNFFGTYTQMVTAATLCQSQNNGDGFEVHLQYTNYPDYPPHPYYAIFWKKCLKFEYGGLSSPGGSWKDSLTSALTGLFANDIHVSELLDNGDGNIRIYLSDPGSETLYESIWSPAVELLDMRTIDPDTDSGWIQTAGEYGVGFVPLSFP